jgi:hypothetical protein
MAEDGPGAPAAGWTAAELAELLHDYGERWKIVPREYADGLHLAARERPRCTGPRITRRTAADLRAAMSREEARRARDG